MNYLELYTRALWEVIWERLEEIELAIGNSDEDEDEDEDE